MFNENQPQKAVIEGARLIFRNFSGAPTKFNPAGGARTVSIVIPDLRQADMLTANNWNVKCLKLRDEEEEPVYYLNAKIKYGVRDPRIVIVYPNGNKAELNEDTVGLLDSADIKYADVVLNPYISPMGNGKNTAYVKTMYVNVEPDEFADKYGGGSGIGNSDVINIQSDEITF